MPSIFYVGKRFGRAALETIDQANFILEEYELDGYTLTLRQLYYQFVARGLMENKDKNYKRLGTLINDARLAGLVDWGHLVDRTRNLQELEHFYNAADALQKVAGWYHIDMWNNQRYRPEVWIEKDALVGVIQRVCQSYDVPYFSCRGYTSQSEMWAAGQRFESWKYKDYIPYVIHLGDHDPSGVDMTRDISDRLSMFAGRVVVNRIALTMAQIEKYNPPPNPAKLTDSRCTAYIDKYGDESWELDALNPSTLTGLIGDTIQALIDPKIWKSDLEEKQRVKDELNTLADAWPDVSDWLAKGGYE